MALCLQMIYSPACNHLRRSIANRDRLGMRANACVLRNASIGSNVTVVAGVVIPTRRSNRRLVQSSLRMCRIMRLWSAYPRRNRRRSRA